jgi:hypothetical protein
MKNLNVLLRVIENLEQKQMDGTITMTEASILNRLIEQAEYQLQFIK